MTSPVIIARQHYIFEMTKVLMNHGYYVGPRDPKRNTAFEGNWMVAEDVNAPGGEDASDGSFCVVGNDIAELIETATTYIID